MFKLRNLNELGISLQNYYKNNFVNEDFKLNRKFKERLSEVLQERNTVIKFNNYSAEITTSSNNKVFCPNQWFYLATFVVEFVSELINYKRVLDSIAELKFNEMTRRQFYNNVKYLKGKDIDKVAPEIKEAILDYFGEDQESSEYLCRFLTDYSWWFGSKTIDRQDFYVSPIMQLLNLLHVTQSYVADIAYFMASDRKLMEYSLHLREQVQEHLSSFDSPGENLIVYGAPGTGKSKYLEDNYPNITRVVFHAEYSYYDFVGNYKPTPLYKRTETALHTLNGECFEIGEPVIDYQFIPGPFINVLVNAFRNSEEKYTLLIEELNRANAHSVFGDIFQLLDRKSDGSSQYKIYPNEELMKYLMSLEDIKHHFTEGLFIPKNMNIVATMNSADQGVYVLDSAFKRRWKFKYMPIMEKGFVHENYLINYAGDKFEWRYIVNSINQRLKKLGINEDRLIGPYFLSPKEIGDSSSFTSKLLIYLWDDVLRYKRDEFFDKNIKTFSDLVEGYYSNNDVLKIKDIIIEFKSKENEQIEEQLEEKTELEYDEELSVDKG